MDIYVHIIVFLLGVVILTIGAHYFVKSSCAIGEYFKMPPLVAGVILVGFGGSFPEIVVSLIASLHQQSNMALGNAVGSNIVNLGLVLGVSALITPIVINKQTLTRDFPALWVVMFVVYGLLWWFKQLNLLVGLVLLVLLVIYLVSMIISIQRNQSQNDQAIKTIKSSIYKVLIIWLAGLALLFISSDLLVSSASDIASHFGMSPLLIGLTIVAIGTSLPEFATTCISAYKGHYDIALGNVLGSNIFNLLAVLAMPALFSPTKVSHAIMTRDYLVMLLLTLIAMIGAIFPLKANKVLGRPTAIIMFVIWLLYYVYLFGVAS